jgi:uncharacterized membrane protein YfcA
MYGGPGIAAGTGLLSGLMNGAFAIPGPPVIIYAMACIPEPANSRGFLMAFFMMSSLISLTTFTVSGLVTTTPFYLLMLSLPAMLMGDRLGTLVIPPHRRPSLSPRSASGLPRRRFGDHCESVVCHGVYCLTLSRTIRAF